MDKLLLYNSIVSKWYQSLDDKGVCNVCSLRVKFNKDLSFNEMRELYSIKLKKHEHTEKESIKKLGRVHGRNFENSRNFPSNFQFGKCGSSDNLSAFIEKRKPES